MSSDPQELRKSYEEAQLCDSPDKLFSIFKKWFHLEDLDRDFIEVGVACAFDREIPGDPVWLYLIAPPGGIKSELLRAIGMAYPKAYTLDTLTESTFISGMAEKDHESGEYVPIAGILQDIDGKTVIIKDFTTVMSMNEDKRNEIYGQLRSIYDGYFEKAFGTMRRKISITASIGLVVGVTPVIDKYSQIQSTLGERFLKIRNNPNRLEATRKALLNEGREERMRQEIQGAMSHFIKTRDFKAIPLLPVDFETSILRLAYYTAYMRTNTWATYDKSGRVVDAELFSTEVPTRIAKQFKHLAKLLCIVRGLGSCTAQELNTLQRVARDTTDLKKQKIIDFMYNHGLKNTHTVASIAGSIPGLYRASAPNHLNLMYELGILDMDKDGNYGVHVDFREYVEAAYTLPPASLQTKLENSPVQESRKEIVQCTRCSKPLKEGERVLINHFYYCQECKKKVLEVKVNVS